MARFPHGRGTQPQDDPVTGARPHRRYWAVGCVVALLAVVGGSIGVGISLSATSAAPKIAHSPAADRACPNPGQATPLVFVHGLNGSPGDFTDHGSPSLASTLTALPGIAASYFDYQAYASDWVTNAHIGPALASDIACLADTSAAHGGSGKVIVVAHSMGGLALRYAAAQNIGGRLVASRIGLAVTVAAPNTGSWIDGMVNSTARGIGGLTSKNRAIAIAATQIIGVAHTTCASTSRTSGALADLQGLCGLILSPESPAGQALVPGSSQLAALPPLAASVPLLAVAGDIRLTTRPLSLGRVTLPVTVALPIDIGDLLVTPASALAEANHPGPFSGSFTDRCSEPLVDVAKLTQAGATSCAHGALLHSPAVTTAVTEDVNHYLGDRS